MKTYNILFFLAIFIFAACNSDDDNGNPPSNRTAAFTGTVNDLINGPSASFSADVIEVLYDTLTDQFYVYLEDTGVRSIGFTIGGTSEGQYFLSASSSSEAFLITCDTVSNDVSTIPNDAGLATEMLGSISIDSYDVAAGRLELTISSLTFYSVGTGSGDDVAELTLTNATLTNATVVKTAAGINYLDTPSINFLVDGIPFDPSFVFSGGEMSDGIYTLGTGGAFDLIVPLDPAVGQYDLAVAGDGYSVAYNVNDLNSYEAHSGTLIVMQSCEGLFYGTFDATVDISTSIVGISEGRFAFQVD